MINRVNEKATYEKGENTNHISNLGLISRIYNRFPKLKNKNQITQLKIG